MFKSALLKSNPQAFSFADAFGGFVKSAPLLLVQWLKECRAYSRNNISCIKSFISVPKNK